MEAYNKKNSLPLVNPPLSSSELENATIEVKRHKVVSSSVSAAAFNIISTINGKQPGVTMRVVPEIGAGDCSQWRVEITLDSGKILPAELPVVQPQILERSTLRRIQQSILYPSMPDDGSEFVKRPQLLPPQQTFKLRFGDIEYEPTTIFSPDGRGPYVDTNYPWGCLCRVQTAIGAGSGVLIGPRHVLTASHVVDWTPGWATVNVFQQNATSRDFANAISAYASTRIGPGPIGDSDSDEDYAVLVLDKPLGDTYGWYGTRTYDSGWDDEVSTWCNIGYPSDRGWNSLTPIFQTNFFLNELGADFGSARLIRSQTFDNWPGQSGGPVFGVWNDGPYVVGVVSGQGSDYNYISGGSLLSSLVSQARSDFP